MLKNILIIPLALVLVACGHKTVDIKADPEPPVVIHPSPPPQLNMREVKWVLFNREKLEQMLAEYPDQEIVLFAISAKGYENLSLNFEEVIGYLEDQKDIIIYYRRLFPAPEKLAEDNAED